MNPPLRIRHQLALRKLQILCTTLGLLSCGPDVYRVSSGEFHYLEGSVSQQLRGTSLELRVDTLQATLSGQGGAITLELRVLAESEWVPNLNCDKLSFSCPKRETFDVYPRPLALESVTEGHVPFTLSVPRIAANSDDNVAFGDRWPGRSPPPDQKGASYTKR